MNRIRRPENSRSGIAALEFALVSPLAVLLMLVTADLGSFLRLRLDLDSTATVMANTVSQYSELYTGDFATLFTAAQTIAGAAQVTGSNGCTIITGIVNSGSGPLVVWQQASGTGSFCVSSFGAAGTVPVLPDSYALPANSTLIAVEVFAPGTPWVLSTAYMGTSASQLQRGYALFQARTAILASITPGKSAMKRQANHRWRRGSIGVMGGLLALPMAAIAGLAVDGARLWMLQNRLQMALDSAALVAARESTTGNGVADGTALFWANFGRTSKTTDAGYMGAVATTPTIVQPDSNTVQMTASATLSTPFLSLLGMPQVSLAATTTGKRTVTGLELSLVLDSSETMTTSNNMAALRQAASNLVNIVYGTPDTLPNLWVSIVPYAGTVNFGPANADWLVAGSLDETQYQNTTWMGCVQARATGGNDQNDASPAAAPFMPFLYASTRGHYFNGTRTVTGDDDWSATHITESTQSTTGDATVGPNLGCPASPVLPLTASKTTVLNTIAGLQATYRDGAFGNLGLQAGWFTLSPTWQGLWGTAGSPLAYGTPNNQKVVVLMSGSISAYNDWAGGAPGQAASIYTGSTTDSDNSAYGRMSANALGITIPHTGNLATDFTNANIAAASAIETRIGALCTAMKSNGVIIYTVAYAVSDSGTLTAWQNCASKPENFFNSPTQTALKTAFQQIGEQLANLWLSQ